MACHLLRLAAILSSGQLYDSHFVYLNLQFSLLGCRIASCFYARPTFHYSGLSAVCRP